MELTRKLLVGGRTVSLFGDITDTSSHNTLQRVGQLARESNEPIILVISSNGGSLQAGFALYDGLRLLAGSCLMTVCVGGASSSALLPFLAGERRFITPYAGILVHECVKKLDATFSASELSDLNRDMQTEMQLYIRIVLERTEGKFSQNLLEMLMKQSFRIKAERAVTLGLAHQVTSLLFV